MLNFIVILILISIFHFILGFILNAWIDFLGAKEELIHVPFNLVIIFVFSLSPTWTRNKNQLCLRHDVIVLMKMKMKMKKKNEISI